MRATAKAKNVRMSARKMRLVIDQIRGRDVNEAYAVLQFSKKKAARPVGKVLRSAVANAAYRADEEGEAVDVDDSTCVRPMWTKAGRFGAGAPAHTGGPRPCSSGAVT